MYYSLTGNFGFGSLTWQRRWIADLGSRSRTDRVAADGKSLFPF